jgi:tripartite-type tricarboxylate transporter receptor subunit TctC
VHAGKLRIIAIATPRRIEALPNVPSLLELGVGGFDLVTSFVFFTPARTPSNTVEKLGVGIREIMKEPEIRAEFTRQGVQVIDSKSPTKLKRQLQAEFLRWNQMVQKAGLAGSE